MELTNEVNNLVAQKIADEIIKNMSEEELTKLRNKAWYELRETHTNGYRSIDKLTEATEKAYMEKFKLEVDNMLSDEHNDLAIKERAKEFVEKCRARAEEKIIKKTSDMIAGLYCGFDGGYDLRGIIKNTIAQEFFR